MLVIAQLTEPVSRDALNETFASDLLPILRERRLTASVWINPDDNGTVLVLAWTVDDSPSRPAEAVLDSLRSMGVQAVAQSFQALTSFMSMPNPYQQTAYCDLQFNSHLASPNRIASCPAGHGFDKRHGIQLCTHDGGQLS